MRFMLEQYRELLDRTLVLIEADFAMEYICRIAFALWGFGLFWLVIALATVVSLRLKEKMRFNMGWWG